MSEFQVTAKSKDAEAMATYLQSVADVLGGIKAMQANWSNYAVRFPKERDEVFNLRKELAVMTNVFKDVVEGLASKPFQHEVEVKDALQQFQPLIEDIDGKGDHLSIFAGNVFYRAITDSITWIRVDYPNGEEFESSAEESASGIRPYWCHVMHKDVLEVRSERTPEGEKITYIRMYEDQDLIIEMEPTEWRRWAKVDDGWKVIEEGVLSIGMIPMIPVITGRRKGKSWQFEPPMLDALDRQIELFRSESALNYGKTMVCFPMLSANGVTPPTDEAGKPLPLETGPNRVLYAPTNAQGNSGSWEYVEPNTSSLKFNADQITEMMQAIRELGKQPLTAQSGNLTRISALAASNKANSAVQHWALILKDSLENALYVTGLWLNINDRPEVSVFTDFRASDDDDKTPDLLLAMRSNGDISQKTLYKEFKRLGRLSDDFDPDDEALNIADELSENITDQ